MRRLCVVPIALLVLVTVAGCDFHPREHPDPPAPKQNTIADAAIGERLTITAGVERRLSAWSFIVTDADLPDDGLLVMTRTPAHVWRLVLVTVTGTVSIFHLADFAALGPDESSRYAAFEGRKVIVADDVRVWGPPSPSPPASRA